MQSILPMEFTLRKTKEVFKNILQKFGLCFGVLWVIIYVKDTLFGYVMVVKIVLDIILVNK